MTPPRTRHKIIITDLFDWSLRCGDGRVKLYKHQTSLDTQLVDRTLTIMTVIEYIFYAKLLYSTIIYTFVSRYHEVNASRLQKYAIFLFPRLREGRKIINRIFTLIRYLFSIHYHKIIFHEEDACFYCIGQHLTVPFWQQPRPWALPDRNQPPTPVMARRLCLEPLKQTLSIRESALFYFGGKT